MPTTCISARCTRPSSSTAGRCGQLPGLLGGLGASLTPSSGRSSGVGRTGAFALLYAAVQEVEAGSGIPRLPQLVRCMRQQRKHMLQEKVRLSRRACALPRGTAPAHQPARPRSCTSSSAMRRW